MRSNKKTRMERRCVQHTQKKKNPFQFRCFYAFVGERRQGYELFSNVRGAFLYNHSEGSQTAAYSRSPRPSSGVSQLL